MTTALATPTSSPLARPVTSLWGVGSERARQLERLNIRSVEDLLLHRPRRYEDRSHFCAIADLQLNEPATTRGRVVALGTRRYRKGTKSIFELILDDGTARLHCRWWNLPFMEKCFAVEDEVVVFGKPLSLKPRIIDHPETEVVEGGEENFIHLNRITSIYPLTEGLPQRWLRSLIWRTLEQFEGRIVESQPRPEEKSSAPVSDRSVNGRQTESQFHFPTRANAIHMLHFPETPDAIEIARRRLALDEFIELQRQIRLRRKKFETKAQALPCGGDNQLIKPFLTRLGFKLTDAQTRVLREIRGDMRGPHPMRRLLQGDVGSGKTVVAACSALMAIESGYNVAVMAPTEILAEQHFRNFRRWCEPLGIRVELQTGSRKTVEGRQSKVEGRQSPALPTADSRPSTLFVGTHALLTVGFDLPRLGLVIIDEQHKFGVSQREQLVRKGCYPHLLVMTATPIPRTLGLTVYGELDASTIDAMPPGRGAIRTFVRTSDKLPKVWSFVRDELREGRQAYIIYPRVEDTGQSELKAVTKEFENVRRSLAPFQIGLIHGRLAAREKENVMAAFRANKIQALLATSLIEVGVDIPNATVMLIENAGQFGLAQLHQLRGRIGRGAHESYCILIAGASNDDTRERLKILEDTTDGFRIAEADLALRGPGELLGQRQSGLPDFRFGNLATDWELIRLARQFVTGQSR